MTALPKDRPEEFGNDIICHTENPYSEIHIEFFNASSVMVFLNCHLYSLTLLNIQATSSFP